MARRFRPVALDGPAIVRLAAAGLNFEDVYRRRGDCHMDATPPWILGYEGAGTIVGLGQGHPQGFAVGDRVGFADAPRANAELVAVLLDKLVPLPAEITFDRTASPIRSASPITRTGWATTRSPISLLQGCRTSP